jgi:hypothetical protein
MATPASFGQLDSNNIRSDIIDSIEISDKGRDLASLLVSQGRDGKNKATIEAYYRMHRELRLLYPPDIMTDPDLFLKLLPTYAILRDNWITRLGYCPTTIAKARLVLWAMNVLDTPIYRDTAIDDDGDNGDNGDNGDDGDEEDTLTLSEILEDCRDWILSYRTINGETLLHLALVTSLESSIPAVALIEKFPQFLIINDTNRVSPLQYILTLPYKGFDAHILRELKSVIQRIVITSPYVQKKMMCHDVLLNERKGLTFLEWIITSPVLSEEELRDTAMELSMTGDERGEEKIKRYLEDIRPRIAAVVNQ